jgi:hypothetical protein
MAYSDFTLPEVKRTFQLTIDEEADHFSPVSEVPVSPWLAETLRETIPLALAIHTEKVRSELIIAPILIELRKQLDRQVSFFSGVDFTVDVARGLNGVCDFIVSQSQEQLFVSAPVLIIVEAKNENIKGGLAQCIAAMLAAQLFNTREANPIPAIYGAVTTGTAWRFLRLDASLAQIDRREHYIDNVEKIVGILVSITGRTPVEAYTM